MRTAARGAVGRFFIGEVAGRALVAVLMEGESLPVFVAAGKPAHGLRVNPHGGAEPDLIIFFIMLGFLRAHLVHVVAALTVLSRVTDILTTYLGSPTLKLEANSLMRRYGWKYAAITILAGFVPYYSIPAGIMLMTVFFFVSASNASKILLSNFLGEKEYAAQQRRMILAAPPWMGFVCLLVPPVLFSIPGFVMLLYYPDPKNMAFYFAAGIIAYALMDAFWGVVPYVRIRRKGAIAAGAK